MSWRWYLNMEPLALSIVEDSLSQMTDSNYDGDCEIEPEGIYVNPVDPVFGNNIRQGFIIVVMLSCYYESSLNTLLRDFFDYASDGAVIKGNEEEKLEVIFNDCKEKLAEIRSTNQWHDAHRVLKMRNHLIHYKENSSKMHASWPPVDRWKIGKENLGDFFTKSNMKKCFSATTRLVGDIAGALDLMVSPVMQTIDSDGRYGVFSSFCTLEEYAMIEEALAREGCRSET